eukprot:scaffold131954_cov33-Prasinocladus_malaysianus.AAC.1
MPAVGKRGSDMSSTLPRRVKTVFQATAQLVWQEDITYNGWLTKRLEKFEFSVQYHTVTATAGHWQGLSSSLFV